MTTGERIKVRRKELGISAEALADTLNVSPATIYRYEKGDIEKLPSYALQPIAEALRTTPAFLMGWEGQKTDEAENKPTTVSSDGLNVLEEKVMLLFRKIPADKQSLVVDMIETALRNQGLLE